MKSEKASDLLNLINLVTKEEEAKREAKLLETLDKVQAYFPVVLDDMMEEWAKTVKVFHKNLQKSPSRSLKEDFLEEEISVICRYWRRLSDEFTPDGLELKRDGASIWFEVPDNSYF